MRFPYEVRLPERFMRELAREALSEDIGAGDVTTRATVGPGVYATARLRLKDDGVIAGLPLFVTVFGILDRNVKVDLRCREGGSYRRDRLLAVVRGKARSILTCERVALNFIQRMSGIATETRRYVRAVKGTRVRIVDTRKTTPGLRLVEKYAVLIGGGYNHRLALSDLAMIKDNHIKAAGGIREAVGKMRRAGTGVGVEVEIGPDIDIGKLADLDVDMVMLDNWPITRLRRAISLVRGFASKPLVEVSGGVNLGTVKRIAGCGPDFISIGGLTHSARSLDISLDFAARVKHG